jgi:hypothetical protein
MAFDTSPPVLFLARPRVWAVVSIVMALFAVLLIALWPKEIPQSDIRVQNASRFTLQKVIVGRISYGDISPGASTSYKTWGPAYPHPRVEFEAKGIRLRQIPEDHFGENILGPGAFTYVITVAEPRAEADFIVKAVKD